jgi:hypothetical protein
VRSASKRKKERLANCIGAFLQQYRRRSQKGQEPNDRSYDRAIERLLPKLKPEDVDAIIHDRLDEEV